MPVLQTDQAGFLLDGQPFRLLSGGLHYFRVHPAQWADRLHKARLMGLNTVETYVPWNLHQPRPEQFRLDGGLDLPRFVELAAAEGLHVLLRPGPYICAEWEGGGLPSWLLAEPDIRLRSRDPRFLAAVDDYFRRLLTPLLPYLASRGGPVLAVQVEKFWIGWFDRWGAAHVVRDADEAARELDDLLSAGASVNFYMLHGGTNFGFTNGANDKHTYRPTVTSYDYDAPLDEAGDPTAKYTAFREVIAKHAPVPEEPVPARGPKLALPPVVLTESADLLPNAAVLTTAAVRSPRPLTMEELAQDFGFVLYETVLPTAGPVLLEVEQVRDRAQVFVDGQPVGVLERENHEHALAFTAPAAGSTLAVLVENQGRVNYGPGIHDRKGLLGQVLLDGAEPAEWSCRPLPLSSLADVPFAAGARTPVGPAFHRGRFEVAEPADTFLHLEGWTKGNAWVNGFPLGRYWSRGPQRSLYVPAPVLRAGTNEVVVLELHSAHRARTVEFRGTPDLGPIGE
ncbi:beta-galactosidase [Streptomyces sp. NRRL S-495]|uniref:beta-galactosidase n=1 Tax=Streptomyces sp. NRRL S-495 TaxID=1609133 RepID=UPI0005F8F4BE|nr:beta-galactosidase [Streptomyces sp. NRRL S-495]KJY26948.1 beta-galactosidase [Streptomyces sp. NRRL S-495]